MSDPSSGTRPGRPRAVLVPTETNVVTRWSPVYFIKRIGLRIVVPAACAYFLHEWAWNMVAQEEFAVAFILLVAYAVVGVFAVSGLFDSTRRPRVMRGIKIGLGTSIVMWAVYSGMVFRQKGNGKPWTSLASKQTPQPFLPTAEPTPTPETNRPASAPLSTPTPTPSISAKSAISPDGPTVSPSPLANSTSPSILTPLPTASPSPFQSELYRFFLIDLPMDCRLPTSDCFQTREKDFQYRLSEEQISPVFQGKMVYDLSNRQAFLKIYVGSPNPVNVYTCKKLFSNFVRITRELREDFQNTHQWNLDEPLKEPYRVIIYHEEMLYPSDKEAIYTPRPGGLQVQFRGRQSIPKSSP